MNHLTTRSILSCSFAPSEIAAKRSGCSHQYAGNSVSEVGDRMTVTRQLSIGHTTGGLELTWGCGHAGQITSHVD